MSFSGKDWKKEQNWLNLVNKPAEEEEAAALAKLTQAANPTANTAAKTDSLALLFKNSVNLVRLGKSELNVVTCHNWDMFVLDGVNVSRPRKPASQPSNVTQRSKLAGFKTIYVLLVRLYVKLRLES